MSIGYYPSLTLRGHAGRDRYPCGNFDPLGVTGTPVVDAATRTLFLDAMITPDGGRTVRHLVFALSIDDGSTRPGWPVDVAGAPAGASTRFDPSVQNQGGAPALQGGRLYLPYGGVVIGDRTWS